jgi:integrase
MQMAKAKQKGVDQDPVTGNWTVTKRVPPDLIGHFRKDDGSIRYNFKQSTGTSLWSDAEELVGLIKADFARRIRVARLTKQVDAAEHRAHMARSLAHGWFVQEFPLERRRETAQHILDHETDDTYDPRYRGQPYDDDRMYQFYRGEPFRQSVAAYVEDHVPDIPLDLVVDEAILEYEQHYELPDDLRRPEQSNEQPREQPGLTLDVAMVEYRADPKTHLAQTTLNNLETARRQLAEFLNGGSWQQVDRKIVGDFVTKWLPARKSFKSPDGQTPMNIKKTCSLLMSFYDWAIMRGHYTIGPNPWIGQAPTDEDIARWKAKHGVKSRRDIRPDETTALLADKQPGTRLGDAMRIAQLCGVRLEEMAQLDAEQLGPNCRYYEVREGKSNNAPRIVPLVDVARDVVLARFKRIGGKGRLFPEVNLRVSTGKYGGALSQEFTRVRRRVLGRETDGELTEHCFRHTWRTCARRAGVDLRTSCEMGGWSTGHHENGDDATDDVYDHGLEIEQYIAQAEKVAAYMRAKGYLG